MVKECTVAITAQPAIQVEICTSCILHMPNVEESLFALDALQNFRIFVF